jgi:hypothetical protein
MSIPNLSHLDPEQNPDDGIGTTYDPSTRPEAPGAR